MALRESLILRKPRGGCLEEPALAKAGDAARPSAICFAPFAVTAPRSSRRIVWWESNGRNRGAARHPRADRRLCRMHRRRPARGMARFLCRGLPLSDHQPAEPRGRLSPRRRLRRLARACWPIASWRCAAPTSSSRTATATSSARSGSARSRTGWPRSARNFIAVRIMHDGEMSLFAAGRYLDRIAVAAEPYRFIERLVILDSEKIDTLLVIPL